MSDVRHNVSWQKGIRKFLSQKIPIFRMNMNAIFLIPWDQVQGFLAVGRCSNKLLVLWLNLFGVTRPVGWYRLPPHPIHSRPVGPRSLMMGCFVYLVVDHYVGTCVITVKFKFDVSGME